VSCRTNSEGLWRFHRLRIYIYSTHPCVLEVACCVTLPRPGLLRSGVIWGGAQPLTTRLIAQTRVGSIILTMLSRAVFVSYLTVPKIGCIPPDVYTIFCTQNSSVSRSAVRSSRSNLLRSGEGRRVHIKPTVHAAHPPGAASSFAVPSTPCQPPPRHEEGSVLRSLQHLHRLCPASAIRR